MEAKPEIIWLKSLSMVSLEFLSRKKPICKALNVSLTLLEIMCQPPHPVESSHKLYYNTFHGADT